MVPTTAFPKLAIGLVCLVSYFQRYLLMKIPGDENPTCTANKIATFLRENKGLSFVDLSYLKNKATLK